MTRLHFLTSIPSSKTRVLTTQLIFPIRNCLRVLSSLARSSAALSTSICNIDRDTEHYNVTCFDDYLRTWVGLMFLLCIQGAWVLPTANPTLIQLRRGLRRAASPMRLAKATAVCRRVTKTTTDNEADVFSFWNEFFFNLKNAFSFSFGGLSFTPMSSSISWANRSRSSET